MYFCIPLARTPSISSEKGFCGQIKFGNTALEKVFP